MFLPLDAPQVGGATRADYQGSSDQIAPVADPNVTSDSMRLQLAGALKQSAATTPGYDHDAVEMRWLKALRVDTPEQVFPGTKGQPPAKDPKLVIAEMKEQSAGQRQQADLAAKSQEFILSLMEERRINNATIANLMAQSDEHAANAQSEQSYAQVAMINAQIASAKHENDAINAQIDHLLRAAEIRSRHVVEIKKLEKPKVAA